MEDITIKRNEKEEDLETSVTSSGRPKRKLKPRNYSDEFYIFDSHGKFLPSNTLTSPKKVKVHKGFTTSTPLKQLGMGKQGKARKNSHVESVPSNNVDSSTISDVTSPISGQSETSEVVVNSSHSVKQTPSREISDVFTLVSETYNQDSVTKNNVIAHEGMDSGQQTSAEETINNGTEVMFMCEKQGSNHVDVSCSNQGKSQSRQSRKKKLVLEEEAKIPYSETGIKPHSLKARSKKRKLNDVSLAKGHNDNDNLDVKDENNKRTLVNKKNVDKTMKSELKKRKIVGSCEDSCLKEKVISEIQRTESCEINKLHSENRNLLDEDIDNSVNEEEKTMGEVVEKAVSGESGTEEVKSSSVGSSEILVSHKKQRKRLPLTHEVETNSPHETGVTPVTVKRQRGRRRKNVSTDLQTTESPETATTHMTQKTPRRKLSAKDRLSEVSADPQLQGKTPEQQFESNGVSAQQKRSQGTPPKYLSQERKLNKSLKTTESHVTQDGDHNASSVDPQLSEVQDEEQSESNLAPVLQKRRQGRPPKNASRKSDTSVDSQVLKVEDGQSESNETPVLQKRRQGRPPKYLSRKSRTNVDSQLQEVEEGQSESNVSPVLQKKRQGRPPKFLSRKSDTSLASQLLEVEDGQSESNETPVLQKRRQGRPPKYLSRKNHTNVDSQLQEVKGQSESNIAPVLQKRRQGRPPKYASEKIQMHESPKTATTDVTQGEGHSSANVEPELLEIKDDGQPQTNVDAVPQTKKRGRPPLSARDRIKIVPAQIQFPDEPSGSSAYRCYHCGLEVDKSTAIRHHMMTAHSLMWSLEHPTGYEDAHNLIKKLGHIVCQMCKKNFRFAQYYRHHQIWCGREDELATCEICGHTCKTMWMQQHVAAHKTQEKKLARAIEQDKLREQEKQDKQSSEDDDDIGDLSAGKKLKRKAAKNAIKLMSSFKDDTEQEQAVSSSSSVEVTSEESSDDDDDDEGDEEEASEQDEEEAAEHGEDKTTKVKRRAKKSEVKKKKSQVKRMENSPASQTVNPVSNNVWMKVCSRAVRMSTKKRLQFLQNICDNQPQEKVFPDLCPKQTDWKQLTDSETKQYLPVHMESLKFVIGSDNLKEMDYGDHSLKFGHTRSHNGTAYCYTGGPVRAVEWCPIPQGTSDSQFLAIAADQTMEELFDVVTSADGPGLIQIWSAGSLANENNCCAVPVLQYAIAHNSGSVHSISWCPRGCFDVSVADTLYLKRLGLFAAACTDGSVLIYSPPHPGELELESNSGEGDKAVPVFRPPPALVLVPNSRKGCGPCVSVAWQQGSEVKYILAGYGHGAVYMWDLSATSPLLRVDPGTLRPSRCFSFHTAAVVSSAWNPVNPSAFVTVSLDFNCCLWNIESPDQPTGIIKRLLVHNMPRSVCWAGPIYNGFFTTCEKLTGCEDTPVCYHGLSKAVLYSTHKYMTVQYHASCTWDVSYSPFYEALVTCDAFGTVKFTVLPMRDVTCQKAGKTSWHRSKSRTLDVYQTRLIPRALLSYTQPQTPPSAADVTCQQTSTAANDNCQQSSTASNESKDGNESLTLDTVKTESQASVNISQAVSSELSSGCTQSDSSSVLSNEVNCHQHGCPNTPARVVSESDSPAVGSVDVKDVSVTNNVHDHISFPQHFDNDANIDVKWIQEDVIVNSVGNTSTASTVNTDVTSAVVSTGCTIQDSSMSSISFHPVEVGENILPENIVLESLSSRQGLDEDNLNTQCAQEAAEDMLHFLNSTMNKDQLMPVRAKFDEKSKTEVFRDNNVNAVHKVRLNPNPGCCLWLASGGQSGILRLDNLSGLV